MPAKMPLLTKKALGDNFSLYCCAWKTRPFTISIQHVCFVTPGFPVGGAYYIGNFRFVWVSCFAQYLATRRRKGEYRTSNRIILLIFSELEVSTGYLKSSFHKMCSIKLLYVRSKRW